MASSKCPPGCTCGRHTAPNKGRHCLEGCMCGRHSAEFRATVSKNNTGRIASQEACDNISRGLKGKPRRKHPPGCGCGVHTVPVERRHKISQNGRCLEGCICKRHYRSPEHTQNLTKAVHISPNKKEKQLNKILKPFGFSFVGDGSFMVGNLNPDFWDGDKGLIELYGDYWHREDDPQERIDFFSQYDYRCLVVWEHELEDLDSLLDRVSQYIGD